MKNIHDTTQKSSCFPPERCLSVSELY